MTSLAAEAERGIVSETVAVIGSGPGGVAAARALLRRGLRVVMLDAGQELDAGRRALAARLAGLDHRRWSAEDVRRLTDNPTIGARKVPKKLVFGSDFLFAGRHPACPVRADAAVAAVPTLARGGFSVAWGGAMLPAAAEDMVDWPFGPAALEESYRRVLAAIPQSAPPGDDGLSAGFPQFGTPSGSLRLPRQAAELLDDLNRLAARPQGRDQLLCGQARLAVRTEEGGEGCRYCGMCLSGCVYGAIHGFDREVEALAHAGGLDYRPGRVVTRLAEDGAGVSVSWRGLDGGEGGEERFARVFLAAGAINSTRILLASRQRYGQAVRFLDSRKFILPLLRLPRRPLEWPDINALPSLFLEARLPELSPHWVHMQISPVNDFVLHRLGVRDRRGWRWQLLAPAVERMMIAWCGLHSSLSDGFTARLRPGRGDGEAGVMELSSVPNPLTLPLMGRLARRMMVKGLGARTLFLPLVTPSETGGGNHFGGSFPMTAEPRHADQSDLLGRPSGWRRVHLVDGSGLPSIPATTVALLIMANADRIATEVPLE